MGVSEGAAYEKFGKRTGVREYIRLSTFLTQNVKKGSTMLLQQLHEEAKEAEEMRMRNARKLCEEASTKLLLPMIMLLLVVMILIMFPCVFQCGSLEKEKNMNHLKTFRQFIKEEDGMGTVEVILIIVVLVGLVVIFKEKITEIVNSIFSKITSQTEKNIRACPYERKRIHDNISCAYTWCDDFTVPCVDRRLPVPGDLPGNRMCYGHRNG